MTMLHAGLPTVWIVIAVLLMAALLIGSLFSSTPAANHDSFSLAEAPLIGGFFRYLSSRTTILLCLKILFVAMFVLIIVSGLMGTPIAERNFSTVVTWNLWWTGIVISVLFVGNAWCAVCPWDTIANWLARRRLWTRNRFETRLNLRVPSMLRNLWPALVLLIILVWLELGVGVTTSPYDTALLALMMVVSATATLVVFRDKAFCRYFCPVGRTIGVYSQVAPVALRPVDTDTCNSCKTLDCYNGNEEIEPCPVKLVMGQLQENTYCIACGNCARSCPSSNISWQLRSPSIEAIQDARPHFDEAAFILGLLAFTSFHGLTMLPDWMQLVSSLAREIGDSGQLLVTFTILLVCYLFSVYMVYSIFVLLFKLVAPRFGFSQIYSGFAFSALPLALAYHVAHNLNHLFKEAGSLKEVLTNPMGTDIMPLSMAEQHQRTMDVMLSVDLIPAIQVSLLVVGFWLSLQVIKYRGEKIFKASRFQQIPLVLFSVLISLFNLFLLSQPMTMRM